MKRAYLLILILVLCLASSGASVGPKKNGTTLQEGVIKYSAGHYLQGQPIPVGFDPYGYNYQAHLFVGSYVNVCLGKDGFPAYDGNDASYLDSLTSEQAEAVQAREDWPYRNDQLVMKWNDAWLSNMDMDGDGKLDRHFGFTGYIGSGAWETNHQTGVNDDGSKWVYFVKIVAAPAGASLVKGTWYAADGTELGPDIWGEFIVVLEVVNDPATGDHGLYSKAPAQPGFGSYK